MWHFLKREGKTQALTLHCFCFTPLHTTREPQAQDILLTETHCSSSELYPPATIHALPAFMPHENRTEQKNKADRRQEQDQAGAEELTLHTLPHMAGSWWEFLLRFTATWQETSLLLSSYSEPLQWFLYTTFLYTLSPSLPTPVQASL